MLATSVKKIDRTHSCVPSPELPLPGSNNIDSKRQIGNGMGQYALGKAAGLVEQQIVEYPRHDTRQNVVVLKAEQHNGDQERCPGKGAQRDCVEILVDDVADQK